MVDDILATECEDNYTSQKPIKGPSEPNYFPLGDQISTKVILCEFTAR